MQETKTSPEQETVPTVLLAENTASHSGFAVLAQNALNAIIVVVADAVALCGKLFFR